MRENTLLYQTTMRERRCPLPITSGGRGQNPLPHSHFVSKTNVAFLSLNHFAMEIEETYYFEDESNYVEMNGGRPTAKDAAGVPPLTRGQTSTGERRTSFETWTQKMTRTPSTRASAISNGKTFLKWSFLNDVICVS